MVKTPCIGVCSTGLGDTVCRGCKRYDHEVIIWNGLSHEQKQSIDLRLQQLLGQVMEIRFNIDDEALLLKQLDVQRIRYPEHRDAWSWLWALLKAGSSQIRDPALFGFSIKSSCQNFSLAELKEHVDQEFYLLSKAHYERSFRLPAKEGGAAGE